MSKCFVCERGQDEAEFCETCQDNFNNGRIMEALYDLGLSMLKELRHLNGASAPGVGGRKMTMFKIQEVGDKKIKLIKEVRGVTGLGLKEAKRIVDACGSFTLDVTEGDAKKIAFQLRDTGARVSFSH